MAASAQDLAAQLEAALRRLQILEPIVARLESDRRRQCRTIPGATYKKPVGFKVS